MSRLLPSLPAGVQRVLVAGSTGAGKTTMAAALARRLGIPHTEKDALFHGPGWVPRPQFTADVAALLASGRWVTEYQYRPVKFGRERRRTAEELAAAGERGVVVVHLRGAREALRWLAEP